MAIYKRDIASINLETGTIHRTFLNHSIGYKDQKADHFGIRVFRDGEPVDLTGVSVQGVFMPPQGDPIAITSGNIVSGNEAEVVLPQACYNYDGQFCLAIKLVDSNNSVTGTMRIVDGMVDNTHASGTVAPTGAVPTYQEILSTYDAMVAATAAANGAIAATYSSSSTYKVGDYCIHDGGLYRCTTAITTAEAWTSGHWTAAKIGPDVSDLKSALFSTNNDINGENGYAETVFNMSINSSKKWTTTNNGNHIIIPVKAGFKIEIHANSATSAIIAFLTDYQMPVINALALFSGATGFTDRIVINASASVIYTAPSDAKYLYVLNQSAGYTYLPDDIFVNDCSVFVGIREHFKKMFLLNRREAKRIAQGTDFDTLTNEGNYYVGSTPDAQSMTNIPAKIPGRLTVFSLMYNVIMQVYDGNASGVGYRYWRVYNNGTWGEWCETLNDININNRFRDKTFVLDRSIAYRLNHQGETHQYKDVLDFNDLTTEGNYYLGSTPEAREMSHIPAQNPGRLTVFSLMYNVVMQTYDANMAGVGRRFWRIYNNGTWGEWSEAQTVVTAVKNMISYETSSSYQYTSSFIITDSYIYMTNLNDNSSEIVYKYDKYTLERIGSIEFTGLIKHANDYVWDSTNKRIYCAIGGATRNVCVFDEGFNFVETITVLDDEEYDIVSLSGIAHDEKTGLWIVSGGVSKKLFLLNNLTDSTPVDVIEYTGSVFQGLSAMNGFLFGIDSYGNVKAFIIDESIGTIGSIVQDTRINGAFYEVEGLQIIKDYIYYNVHYQADVGSPMESLLFAVSIDNVLTNPLLK